MEAQYLLRSQRGVIGLQDNVRNWIPELVDLKRFDGWTEEGEPILMLEERLITVEDLITHQAGYVDIATRRGRHEQRFWALVLTLFVTDGCTTGDTKTWLR